MPILWAQLLITIPAYVLAETTLGMLGLGVMEPLPSWGNLLRELEGGGMRCIRGYWRRCMLLAAVVGSFQADVRTGGLFGMTALLAILAAGLALGGELRFALHDSPKTTDPLMIADESAGAIGYLTEGVLIRVNRGTQKPEPELATSWKVSKDSRRSRFSCGRA